MEFAWSVRVALLGVSPNGLSSFQPSSRTLGDDWAGWLEGLFAPVLGPTIRETHLMGQEFLLREIAAIDRGLVSQLSPPCSSALMGASLPFVEGKEHMRGHREWSRYVAKLDSGEAPGHLPVIFALHSLLFRLPLTSALLAYAWLEWKSGHRSAGLAAQSGNPEFPPDLFLLIQDWIAPVISCRDGNNDNLDLRLV